MDYKYIEQLLQHYWNCETTLQEESILRNFFAQDDVPAHLSHYKELFVSLNEVANKQLPANFDERILAIIEDKKEEKEQTPRVKARRIHLGYCIRPFFKAVAVVAVILSISMAVQQAMQQNQTANVETLPPEVVPSAPETALGQPNTAILPDTLDRVTGKDALPGQTLCP